MKYLGKEVKLTKNHNNAAISISVLDDDEMRKLHFTDYVKDAWYYCKPVYQTKYSGITFNLSVKKKNPNDWEIDVLDEAFCQPYDYQYFLTKDNPPVAAIEIKESVEKIMKELTNAGIVKGHNYGEYI